jgi:hypothetical protein
MFKILWKEQHWNVYSLSVMGQIVKCINNPILYFKYCNKDVFATNLEKDDFCI